MKLIIKIDLQDISNESNNYKEQRTQEIVRMLRHYIGSIERGKNWNQKLIGMNGTTLYEMSAEVT